MCFRRGFKVVDQQIFCARHGDTVSPMCYNCKDASIHGVVSQIISNTEDIIKDEVLLSNNPSVNPVNYINSITIIHLRKSILFFSIKLVLINMNV